MHKPSWWPHAATTDPSKLRSLLLHPSSYPRTTLHEGGSYAVQHELLLDKQGVRATVYGAGLQPDYHAAWAQVLRLQPASETIKCSAIPAAAVPAAQAVLGSAGYHQTYCSPCYQYVATAGAAATIRQQVQAARRQLDPLWELGGLSADDASRVDELWTYRGPGTLAMVQQLIGSNASACVRLAAEGPVSWALEVEPGCAGMMHTLQQHRRRGLARVVLLHLLDRLLQQHDAEQRQQQVPLPGGVYCYIVADNAASIALVEGLGLQRSDSVFCWMGFERQLSP